MDTNKHELKTENVTRIARIFANEFQFALISEIRVKAFVSFGVHAWFQNC